MTFVSPRPPVPTSIAAIALWTVVTATGFGLLGSAGVTLQGLLSCAVLQSALLFFWNRQLSWRWLLGGLVFGLAGGLISVFIVVAGGLSGLLPELVAVSLSGAVGGAGLGLGGYLALRSLGKPGAAWILISALAWALGCGITIRVLSGIDPHGMNLFQDLTAAGFGEMLASRIVGARSGGLTGLIAGGISAILAATILKLRGAGQAGLG